MSRSAVMTTVRRGVVALGVAIVLLLALRAVAQAHAMLVSAEPAANSHLASSPERVRLVFSEEIDPALAQLSIVANDGTTRQLALHGDARDVRALIGAVESLPAGAYRVRWRVVSADGHPVEGTYAFWVGSSQAAPPAADTTTGAESPVWGRSALGAPIVPAALRGLALAALMALTGLLGFASFSSQGEFVGAKHAQRTINRLSVSAALFLTLHFVAWLVNASPSHRLGGDETAALVRSGVARVEEWRVGLAVLALWASWLARRYRLAFVFAAAAILMSGSAGHSAAMHPMVAVPAKALHLAAGAAWLGGLSWLLVAPRNDAAAMRREAMRVSAVALWAVFLVALTGTIQAIAFLPSVRALFTSAYGAITLAKVAGLGVLIGFGAYHRSRSLPRISSEGGAVNVFRRAVRLEGVVMILVILLGGWLAYVSPPPSVTSASHATPTHS